MTRYLDLARRLWPGIYVLAKRTHWRRSEMFDGLRELDTWGEEGGGQGAAVDTLGPAQYISAYRELPGHTDPESKPWSQFLLLRTRHSEVWGQGVVPARQVPGMFMQLNVHETHGLRRSYPYACLWTAAIIDTDEPISEKETIERFEQMAIDLRAYCSKGARK